MEELRAKNNKRAKDYYEKNSKAIKDKQKKRRKKERDDKKTIIKICEELQQELKEAKEEIEKLKKELDEAKKKIEILEEKHTSLIPTFGQININTINLPSPTP